MGISRILTQLVFGHVQTAEACMHMQNSEHIVHFDHGDSAFRKENFLIPLNPNL